MEPPSVYRTPFRDGKCFFSSFRIFQIAFLLEKSRYTRKNSRVLEFSEGSMVSDCPCILYRSHHQSYCNGLYLRYKFHEYACIFCWICISHVDISRDSFPRSSKLTTLVYFFRHDRMDHDFSLYDGAPLDREEVLDPVSPLSHMTESISSLPLDPSSLASW